MTHHSSKYHLSLWHFIIVSVTICVIAPFYSLNGQAENRLLHPDYTDKYLSYTFLPEGGVRIFWISDEYEGSGAYIVKYTDIDAGISLDSIESIHVDVPDSYNWNYGSFEYVSLHLADGSTLLMNNTPGCDVASIGAVVKVGSDGAIEWFTDFDKDAFYVMATKMVFLDQHRIGIDGDPFYGPDMIIDRQGNLLSVEEEVFFPYEETIETNNGFVAQVENRLDILDTSFQVISSHTINQPIVKMDVHPGNSIIVQTQDSFYLLSDQGQLSVLPLPSGDLDLVWPEGNTYWAASGSQHQVIHFDSSFMPLEIYPLPPGVDVDLGFSLDSTIVVGGSYANEVNEGMLVYKAKESEVDFNLEQDISLLTITIPDTVVVEYINEPFFGGGWIHHYDFIYVEVMNSGPDTIHELIIQDHATTHCFFCHSAFNRWYIDTVSIPPGMTTTVSLGSYIPVCLYNDPGELCLSVLSPNEKADGNYLNDSHCQPFSILISADEVKPFVNVNIKPNPVDDILYIDSDISLQEKVSVFIFNMAGQMMEEIQIISDDQALIVKDYPAGMYIIQIVDSQGHFYPQHFIVQH